MSFVKDIQNLKTFNLMVSIEVSWWNILTLKIYTTIGYIVSLILLNSRIVSCGWRCKSETRVPSLRGLVKQYYQELCISSKLIKDFVKNFIFCCSSCTTFSLYYYPFSLYCYPAFMFLILNESPINIFQNE